MKSHFYIEMTDTYGGEANYCWVNRFIVSARTTRGAMRRVLNRTGDRASCSDRYNTPETWDSRTACIRYFVEWVDDDDIARITGNYSNVEVIE